LADSLHVPVDSVGVTIEREGFNPLAARAGSVNVFDYNTTYNKSLRAQSIWTNVANYNFTRGPLFVRNNTEIDLNRYQSTNTVFQTRLSTTEVGWKLSPSLSLGGRASLNRTDSNDPSSFSQIHEKNDQYGLSVHNRRSLMRGFTTQLDVVVGALDLHKTDWIQQGLSVDANARTRQVIGHWFTHEVTGRLQPDFTHKQVLASGVRDNSPDFVGNLAGTLTLFNAARVGMRTTYNLSKSDVATPADTVFPRLPQSHALLEAALRTKLGQDGYVNVTQSLSSNHSVTGLNGPQSQRSATIAADGHATLLGWGVEGRFQTGTGHNETSVGSTNGGYVDNTNTRLLEGAMNRRFFERLIGRLSGSISLNSSRTAAFGNYGTPLPSKDVAQQS